VWAGVDKVWEQEKLEARKMLVNRADSHTSGARFVSQPARLPEPLPKKDDTANMTRFYLQLCFLPKPKNFMRTKTLVEKRQTLL